MNKKYTAILLPLLFTASANAANTFNVNTNTLTLDSLVILPASTKSTGVVAQLSNVDILSENLTPPQANELTTFDTNQNVLSVPSITYQDGSQHYHVQAYVGSYTLTNPGVNAGTVSLPTCYYFNIDNPSIYNQFIPGMTYAQVNQIMGCPLSNISWLDFTAQGTSPKMAIMTWDAPNADYAVQVTFNASAANIANYTVIQTDLLEN